MNALDSGVMNTDRFARATFVIHRETHDQLRTICKRMGVSRSDLVRDVLAEPVAMMAGWVSSVPENPTEADAAQLLLQLREDVGQFLDDKSEFVGGPVR